MTLVSVLPQRARQLIRTLPSASVVVALLLAGIAAPAFAQGTPGAVVAPIAFPISSVDSVVSKVNGPILDVLDGALQIDVSNATIVGGDDRLASPVPWAGILVGSRVVATVIVPDVVPAIFPPRLSATYVVVYLANSGVLNGVIQGVSPEAGRFMLLFTGVQTNAATEWSGTKADGSPVKGIDDLSAGMIANVAVTADANGVLARRVFAYGIPTTRIIAFRGKVEKIDGAIWTIGDHVVQVNADTKIVGDPKVGDLVDVVEKVMILPPGSMAPTTIPVAISITKVTILPPNDRFVEFDGIVDSIPNAPAASTNGAPLGHWEISGKDVVVNGLTKVDQGITTGTAVHVKGVALPMSLGANTSNAGGSILALEITKR